MYIYIQKLKERGKIREVALAMTMAWANIATRVYLIRCNQIFYIHEKKKMLTHDTHKVKLPI